MKIQRSNVATPLFLGLLSCLTCATATAVEWTGSIGGEEVKMSIEEGEFIKTDHILVVEDEQITKIDGFEAMFARPDNFGRMPQHIKNWTIQWAGKKLELPKGIYTSIFHPNLQSIEEKFEDAQRGNAVWLGASDDGESLLIIMLVGEDAVHYRIAFTISKEGEASRFMLEVIS